MVVDLCLIICSMPTLMFLSVTSFNQLMILCVFTNLTNTFLNPSFQALFMNMAPRERRGCNIASMGAGAIWIMGEIWGSRNQGMLSVYAETLLSGYKYNYNKALPWHILSAFLLLMGILFIVLVQEPENVKILKNHPVLYGHFQQL